VQHLAAAHGVAEVDLPAVVGPQVAEGRGGAALGHHGVGLAEQGLADDGDLGAGLLGGDRGPETGAAGADHDDVVPVLLDVALRAGRLGGGGHLRPFGVPAALFAEGAQRRERRTAGSPREGKRSAFAWGATSWGSKEP